MLRTPRLLLLLAVSMPCIAAAPPDSVIAAWFQGNVQTLFVSVPDHPDRVTYAFEITPDSDIRVSIDSNEAKGTLMLISGVLLSKGVPLQAGYEVDAIDGPALMLQLANQLLAFAAGVPPSAASGSRAIDLSEPSIPIRVATTSASGDYGAPWHLKGSLKSTTSEAIEYSLTFTFTGGPTETFTLILSGSWERRTPPPAFPDSLSLQGWRVFTFGVSQRSDSQGTAIDYGASPSGAAYDTVGTLRAAQRNAKRK